MRDFCASLRRLRAVSIGLVYCWKRFKRRLRLAFSVSRLCSFAIFCKACASLMPSLLFAPGSVRLRHQRPDNQKAYLAELQRQAERDKKKNKGNFVYYCAWEDRPDAIKIGFTTNVLDRMKSFLTGSPSNLLMLALSQVNGPHDEAALHSEFKNSRIRGEWFNLDKNFVQHIFSIDQSLAFSIHKQFPEHYKNCIIVPTIEDYINTVM